VSYRSDSHAHTHGVVVQNRDSDGYAATMDEYSRTFISNRLPGCITAARPALDAPLVADAMLGADPFTPGGALAGWSVKDRLKQLTIPVLLTRGREGARPPSPVASSMARW
jgi:pimeloyl-ACP methyl ester carboxylesterase